jgi:hypothetical protein
MRERSQLHIDALKIKLPAGFDQRAEAIARAAARELARLPVTQSATLREISVPAIVLAGGETNAAIARRIAGAIHGQMTSRARQGGSDAD